MLLHDTVEIVYDPLLLGSAVTEPLLLHVLDPLVVCFGSVSIYILPVLRPLLGVVEVALDVVKRANDFFLRICLVHGCVDLLDPLLLYEVAEVSSRFLVSVVLILLQPFLCC